MAKKRNTPPINKNKQTNKHLLTSPECLLIISMCIFFGLAISLFVHGNAAILGHICNISVMSILLFVVLTNMKIRIQKEQDDAVRASWRAKAKARRAKKEGLVTGDSSYENPRKVVQRKSRIDAALNELKYVPKENLDYAVSNTALKYGIATTVLMEHFMGKKQKEVCRKSERSFILDYYAADPDSYEYMLSRGLDPHDRNQKLTDEERFDLYDELYFGDEDDYDVHRGFDDGRLFHDYGSSHHSGGLFGNSHHSGGLFGDSHHDDGFWHDADHDHDW